jgi:hypothetical protein
LYLKGEEAGLYRAEEEDAEEEEAWMPRAGLE